MKTNLLYCLLLTCIIQLQAQTNFAARQIIDANTGADPFVMASGDLDGDTDIDIVIGTSNGTNDVIKIYLNNGNGSFPLLNIISNSNNFLNIGGLAIADINGDNLNEIIASSYANDKVVYFINDGGGLFSGENSITTGLDGPGQVVVVDVNNDDELDVVSMGYDGGKVAWFAGNGSGGFGAMQIIDTVTNPGNISFADIDEDGDLDALVGEGSSNGTIEVYFNQYVESGTSTVSWVKDTNLVSGGNDLIWVAAFADVNDDGNIDIIKSDLDSGDVAWYNREANGSWTETSLSTDITRPAVVAVADLDNDTYNDVIITDGIFQEPINWLESTNSGAFNSPANEIGNSARQNYTLTIADFDGDGDKDIATVDFRNDNLYWFENELELLSSEEFETFGLAIYPNPVKDELNVSNSRNNKLNISFYDILGKQVLTSTLSSLNNKIDTSSLNQGLYFLKFEGIDTTYKLIKQ